MNIKIKSKINKVMFLTFLCALPSFSFALVPESQGGYTIQAGTTQIESITQSADEAVLNSIKSPNDANSNTVESKTASNQTSNTTNTDTNTTNTLKFNSSSGLYGLLIFFGKILKLVLSVIISLAVVWFLYNVFRFAIATDEIKSKEARDAMIWGIVAIFVMVSIWGLVAILQSTFSIGPSKSGPNLDGIVPKFNLTK